MRRLFIKAYLGICLIMALGIAAILTIVVVPQFADFSRIEFRQESAFEYQVVRPKLAAAPVDEWPELLAAYHSYFELSAELIKTSELPEESEPFTIEETITGFFMATDDEDFYTYYPSPQEGQLIRFKEGESEWVDPSDLEGPLLFLLIGPLVVVLLTMFLGIAYLLYRLNKPLSALEVALSEFTGLQQTQLPQEAMKALPNISEAFHSMAEQIQRLVSEQQVMIAAIPHELRTPVARIRFALDLLAAKADEPSLQVGLGRLDQYVQQLEDITEAVLAFSRIERDELYLEPVDLNGLLTHLCRSYDNANQINLELPAEPVVLMADKALLTLALGNLVGNAHHYTKADVKITLCRSADSVAVTIENPCDAIPAEVIAQLFTPFYRADKSRSRNSGGLGIGLALAKRVIDTLGGSIVAEQPSPDRFSVRVVIKV
ncbi:HAMP domain-containing sensor histidine kinase [Neptunomonas sp. XY-337]|uniref:sensor histidine kinase n=1 Tax=Neptunomonas sp. XY-337 TaxID=2561897 RepID=UPI0010AAFDB2|nr:HAMP domain-containing sensor histidine kinase [Neptunomonas sp. XY-337]